MVTLVLVTCAVTFAGCYALAFAFNQLRWLARSLIARRRSRCGGRVTLRVGHPPTREDAVQWWELHERHVQAVERGWGGASWPDERKP